MTREEMDEAVRVLSWGDRRLPVRFWSRVIPEPNSGCWFWIGAGNGVGHGKLRVDGRSVQAYRLSWEAANGPIPRGLVMDHLCRNPYCVNPLHVEPVTMSENTLRGDLSSSRGSVGHWLRRRTHCANGHAFDDENTIRRKNGQRGCRACRRIEQARYRERRAANEIREADGRAKGDGS